MARKPVIDLGAAIGAELGREPEEPAPAPPVPAQRPANPPPVKRESRRRRPEPAPREDEARSQAWDARMSLTLSKEMKRALDVARVDDGLEGTARIRAMITLWQEDARLRRRVDKLAMAPAHPREEEPRSQAWDARMSLTLSKEMKRALDVARVDDGLEGTARIRAMITLWQEDARLRRRVDKLAAALRT
jgi:hypothetical protein